MEFNFENWCLYFSEMFLCLKVSLQFHSTGHIKDIICPSNFCTYSKTIKIFDSVKKLTKEKTNIFIFLQINSEPRNQTKL